MRDQLQLKVVTPLRRVIEDTVKSVTLPGIDGELGIMPEHIPLVTILDTGVLSYQDDDQSKSIAVHGGYAQVESNNVTILADLAETADEIDVAQAQTDEEDAREALSKISTSAKSLEVQQQIQQYENKLKSAIARQQAGRQK